MIRFSSQRRDGVTGRLDLYARWPGLTGYTERDRAIFNLLTPKRHLIFMSIEQRRMSRDMSGRYLPIYADLIDPTGEVLPGNLTVHRFLENSGYKGEELVLSDPRSGKPEFVARCLADTAAESFNSCERDVQFGRDLQILYRFPAPCLATGNHWTRRSSILRTHIFWETIRNRSTDLIAQPDSEVWSDRLQRT